MLFAITGSSVQLESEQAIKYGPCAAMVAVAGDELGTGLHIVIALESLTRPMTLSTLALINTCLAFLQITRGVVIIFVACQSFKEAHLSSKSQIKLTTKASFWTGFFTCLTNPKPIVFLLDLLPNFMSPNHTIILQGAL